MRIDQGVTMKTSVADSADQGHESHAEPGAPPAMPSDMAYEAVAVRPWFTLLKRTRLEGIHRLAASPAPTSPGAPDAAVAAP